MTAMYLKFPLRRSKDFIEHNTSSEDAACGTRDRRTGRPHRRPRPAEHQHRLKRSFSQYSNNYNDQPREPLYSPPFNSCDVLNLMDYYTLVNYENGNVKRAVLDILYWMSRANDIFIKTEFRHYKGMTNRVRKIMIMTSYSEEHDYKNAWNRKVKGKNTVSGLISNLKNNRYFFG